MNRLLAIAFVLACFAAAQADVTIYFDPNDILDNYATDYTGSKTTQENARRIHTQWGAAYYGTFSDYMQAGHSQPSDWNTYVNWRNSLTDVGEGIAVFNTWFLDDVNAPTWGEKTVVKPGSTVAATAADGWNVDYIYNPYNLGGTVVQFYTLDPTKRLRPTDLGGANIGGFSITADLYYDSGPAGWDVNDVAVPQNAPIRFWVGNLNGDDPGFYRSDTQALFFDGAAYSDGAGHAGSGFEAVLTAVPAPGAFILAAMGMGLVGWVKRRFA